MLKIAPRTLSPVGRTFEPRGARRSRPRAAPPVMRIESPRKPGGSPYNGAEISGPAKAYRLDSTSSLDYSSRTAMRYALLPAKPLALAKSRLAPHLRDADRAALSFAMFHDVLDCLCRAQNVDVVAVVTADRRLLDLATRMHAVAVDEGRPRGPNAILRVPPTAISTRFGGRSFQDHVSAAADAEVSWSSIDLPGLAFDIDTIDDVHELVRVE